MKLVPDYRQVLAEVGGGEGPVGEAGYLVLWPPEELAAANRGYKVDADYADGLLLIGTDGGNEAFAVRLNDGAYMGAPLIGMSAEAVQELGLDFAAFLRSFD